MARPAGLFQRHDEPGFQRVQVDVCQKVVPVLGRCHHTVVKASPEDRPVPVKTSIEASGKGGTHIGHHGST